MNNKCFQSPDGQKFASGMEYVDHLGEMEYNALKRSVSHLQINSGDEKVFDLSSFGGAVMRAGAPAPGHNRSYWYRIATMDECREIVTFCNEAYPLLAQKIRARLQNIKNFPEYFCILEDDYGDGFCVISDLVDSYQNFFMSAARNLLANDSTVTGQVNRAKDELFLIRTLQMEYAINNSSFAGADNRYYLYTVDTKDAHAVAKALVRCGISENDVARLQGEDVITFAIYKGEFEIGKKLSKKLPDTLVFVEDAWDQTCSEIYRNGTIAVEESDYTADVKICRSDEDDDYCEVSFSIYHPDGSLFASGGSGMVWRESIKEYLGFTKNIHNKEDDDVSIWER